MLFCGLGARDFRQHRRGNPRARLAVGIADPVLQNIPPRRRQFRRRRSWAQCRGSEHGHQIVSRRRPLDRLPKVEDIRGRGRLRRLGEMRHHHPLAGGDGLEQRRGVEAADHRRLGDQFLGVAAHDETQVGRTGGADVGAAREVKPLEKAPLALDDDVDPGVLAGQAGNGLVAGVAETLP